MDGQRISVAQQQQQQQHQQHQQHQQQQQQPVKRRRYRIPRSCDRCRTSKIKCVFENGQCAACVNVGVACTFANPGSLRERPPTRKDVEHLEARIRSLERLIYAIDPSYDLSNLPEPPPPLPSNLRLGRNKHLASSLTLPENLHPVHNLKNPNFSAQNPNFSAPKNLLQPTSSDVALNTLFNPTRFQLNSGTELIPSASTLEDLSPVDKIIRREHQKLSYRSPNFFPPPDLQQSLIEIFFREVHSLLPMLHLPSFLEDFKAGRANTDDGFRSLCGIIFSLASRFSTDPRVYPNLEGSVLASRQTAGLLYCISSAAYLFRLIPTRATLCELQAFALLVIYCLGAVSQDLVWQTIGFALQRFQIAEAHIENSSHWKSSPMEDHFRRKAFFMLYEFDYKVSAALGRPAFMRESDFDVLPPDAETSRELEFCPNPFVKSNGTENDPVGFEINHAYLMTKTSLGGLKNLLPLIKVINSQRDTYPGAAFSNCIKTLIKQLDDSMTTSFQKVVDRFNNLHDTNANLSDSNLLFSVLVRTWYHEFRLLLHQVLFNWKEKSPSDLPVKEEARQGGNHPSPTTTKSRNPYLDICVESAREIVRLVNQLHQRNLLTRSFFWIPLRLKNALLVLICVLVKQRKHSEDKRQLISSAISMGIEILSALAPCTYPAEECYRLATHLYEIALQKTASSSTSSTPHAAGADASPPSQKFPGSSSTESSLTPPETHDISPAQPAKSWILSPPASLPTPLPHHDGAPQLDPPTSTITSSPLQPDPLFPASFNLDDPFFTLLNMWPEALPPPSS